MAAEEAVATIGITDHAQEQLGEIVYIELPSVGDKVSKDDPFGVVESVKAVSDIYAPVSGTVIEVKEISRRTRACQRRSVWRRLADQGSRQRSHRLRRPDGERRVRRDRRQRKRGVSYSSPRRCCIGRCFDCPCDRDIKSVQPRRWVDKYQ